MKDLELQKEAVRAFGMDVQLLHAVEELTELSLEVQRIVRKHRMLGHFGYSLSEILEEFCDARNALATVELLLLSELGSEAINREQKRKDAKFAQIIQKAKKPQ